MNLLERKGLELSTCKLWKEGGGGELFRAFLIYRFRNFRAEDWKIRKNSGRIAGGVARQADSSSSNLPNARRAARPIYPGKWKSSFLTRWNYIVRGCVYFSLNDRPSLPAKNHHSKLFVKPWSKISPFIDPFSTYLSTFRINSSSFSGILLFLIENSVNEIRNYQMCTCVCMYIYILKLVDHSTRKIRNCAQCKVIFDLE